MRVRVRKPNFFYRQPLSQMTPFDVESNSAPKPSRKKIKPNKKNEYGEQKLEYGADFTYVKIIP